MQRRTFIISILILLTISLFLFLFHYKSTKSRQIKKHLTLAERLNLSKEQIEKEKVIREQTRKEIKPVLKKLAGEYSEYNDLVKEKADKKEIELQKQIINHLTGKYNKIHEQHLHKIEHILTVKQKETLKNIREEQLLNN